MFETSRFLLNKKTVKVGNFLNVTDAKERNGKSLRQLEDNFYNAHTVQERQTALEDYLETQVSISYSI